MVLIDIVKFKDDIRSRLINTLGAHPLDVKDLDKLLAVQELTYEHRTTF
jgi:hypothetical protein